ncbi:hypothetical protein PRK78_001943 [Emydomyces testavorans]|uniref:Thioredoxin-like protein n=1 Tax=Emydomyces testavorans TaxID=2070801 RepID=A0AAF0DDZ3_9EURO|nr:hypothetical protein PRK78_001943 [Emydomyces testavorans]
MPPSHASDDNDDNTDALLDALEHEDPSPDYTAQRLAQLKSDLSAPNPSAAPSTITTLLNNSPLPTLPSDQSILDFTTQRPHCIIHFFHPDFSRCATMDKHLTVLSAAHSSGGAAAARFARADVRNAPFVVEKLKIRVLPCVIGFVEGEVRERVVGFEGLGWRGDDFETGALEERFVRKGVLGGVKVGRRDGESDEDRDEEGEREERRKTIRSGRGKMVGGGGGDDDSD